MVSLERNVDAAMLSKSGKQRLTVVNAGIGMPAALAARLFEDLDAQVFRIAAKEGDPFEAIYPAYSSWCRDNIVAHPEDLNALLSSADVCIIGGEDHPDCAKPVLAASILERSPQCVVLEFSGYGVADPEQEHRCVDILVQARSGIAWEQAAHPRALACPLPTYGMVLQGVVGVWTALIERLTSGEGQVVRTSLLQGGAMFWSHFWLSAQQGGGGFDRVAPRAVRQLVFECHDGDYVQLTMGIPGALQKLYVVLGIEAIIDPADRGRPDATRGPENYLGETALIASHVKRFQRAQVLQRLWEVGYPADAVLDPGKCWQDAQVDENGFLVRDEMGLRAVGSPICFSSSRPKFQVPQGASRAMDRHALGPLHGIRIVDMGAVVAGPYASALLADLGADVIKVEPFGGDFNRAQARTTLVANRGKRSIVVDAKSAKGAEVIKRLCLSANAVHHNFRVGVAERLGVDPEALRVLRDDIVTLETTAYGTKGPKASSPGFDMVLQAYCGHEVRAGGEGNPPHCSRTPFIDFAAGALGAIALLRGIYDQKALGCGGHATTSLLQSGLFLMSELVELPAVGFAGAPLLDKQQRGFGPFERIYTTKDGHIAIAARGAAMVSRLLAILDIDTVQTRANGASLAEQIAAKVACWGTHEALRTLAESEVWAEPCVDLGWIEFANIAARAGRPFLKTVHHPEHGAVTGWLAPLFNLSGTPLDLPARASPSLGADGEAILVELGFSRAEIESMRREGATL
jgi:crotonobetainyl-CoA:carnitine CoA-transferase CaiB-like acyl-CoA transferase